MKIIVGLGNPGKKYEKTRHNLGFMFLDFLRNSKNFPPFEDSKKLKAFFSKKNETILIKPLTFINLSGETVRKALDFYKLKPEDILVVHDDIDIDFGKHKTAFDSSSAGHNGIKDIIEKIGTQKFRRIRVGIKNSSLRKPFNPTAFVLQKFEKKEIEKIEEIFSEIVKYYL